MFEKSEILPLAGAILLPNVGAIPIAMLTRREVKTWYQTLRKPSWTPPDWVFGPMWTALYTGMGTASYLVWRDGGGFNGSAKLPLALYGTSLALNWLWTPIFFGAHKKGLALAEVVLLWGSIGACAYTFLPINHAAAYLMLPYWAWVTLASALTYRFWKDNKDKTE